MDIQFMCLSRTACPSHTAALAACSIYSPARGHLVSPNHQLSHLPGGERVWHSLCREHVLQQLWRPSAPNWCGDSSSHHFRTTKKHHPVGHGAWLPHRLTRGCATQPGDTPFTPMGWSWSMRDRTREAAGRWSLPLLPTADCCEVQWCQSPVCRTI